MSGTGRRLASLLVVLGLLGTPAVALRAACIGPACDEESVAEPEVPFCSLPAALRDQLRAGFREGRSPEALGVTTADAVLRSEDSAGGTWPSIADADRPPTVPLVVAGPAVGPDAEGEGRVAVTLADVAPTLEPVLGFRRPFPGVRSGEPIAGVLRPGVRSPLVVTIVWKRAGEDARAAIEGSFRPGIDVASLEAAVGSLPVDAAAILTTIGSGGLPSEHGITGATLRNDRGEPAPAWSDGAPPSVIATLGDDLDEATEGDARIGIVADEPTDRGLIGGTWYAAAGDADDDDVVVERRRVADAVDRLLDAGYGGGGAPDLLGVTLGGQARRNAATTRAVADAVFARVPEATVVVTATGSGPGETRGEAVPAAELAAAVEDEIGAPVVGAVAAGGVFVDADVVTERNLSTQRVVDAMASVRSDGRSVVFADAFPAFVVSFGRYC